MGQCNSTAAVASTAPQEASKTPRAAPKPDLPAQGAASPTAAEVHEPAKADAHSEHHVAATEARPFCDAASLLKPVEEVSLLAAEEHVTPAAAPTAPGAPKEAAAVDATTTVPAAMTATEHGHASHSEPQHNSPAAKPDKHPSTELSAHLQDSAKDTKDPQHTEAAPALEQQHMGDDAGHKANGSAGGHAAGVDDAAAGEADGHALAKEHSSTEGGSMGATCDGAMTQHSIKSNSSVSPEHSSLSGAASSKALHDEVSQSALKGAPSAAVSMAPSHMASGELAGEHEDTTAEAPAAGDEAPAAGDEPASTAQE